MSDHRFTTVAYIRHRSWLQAAGVLLFAATAISASAQSAAAAPAPAPAWNVSCPGKETCVAHLDHNGVQILIGRTKAKSPLRMAFRVSAASKKGNPVALRLNDGWQAGLRVSGCTKSYCEAGVARKATSIAVGAFSRAKTGVIAYAVKDRIILIEFPLDGFGDAMKRVGL